MSTTEKTKAQIAFETINEYVEANPGSSVSGAAEALAEQLNSTPGALKQAYYHHRQRMNGAPTQRPRRRSSVVSTSRAVEPMHEILKDVQEQSDALLEAVVAFKKSVQALSKNITAHDAKLEAERASLAEREGAIQQIEAALAAVRSAL